MGAIKEFIGNVEKAAESNALVRILISDRRDSKTEVKSVTVRAVKLKKGEFLSFVYRYTTKDITKNHLLDESLEIIEKLISEDYMQAELQTSTGRWVLSTHGKRAKIKFFEQVEFQKVNLSHDKQKNRIIEIGGSEYLKSLGVSDEKGRVRPKMNHKYRQINKYIEIVDDIIKNIQFKEEINIVDMGSGKGYLTFALYDYFTNHKKMSVNITGVEIRKELVDKCNSIAQASNFDNLKFVESDISSFEGDNCDVLIALHACDTATDDAIVKGVRMQSKLIIVAPCCHKQIRKQLNPESPLNLVSRFGIYQERLAETITDSLRVLALETCGYKTNVEEFIAMEHTPKNILISAVFDRSLMEKREEKLEEYVSLKKFFGIEKHYLENFLEIY